MLSIGQQHQHDLELVGNAESQAPLPQTYWNSSKWFLFRLKFGKLWCSPLNPTEPQFPALQYGDNTIDSRVLYKELLRSFVMYLAWSWTTACGLKINRFLVFSQHQLLLNNITLQSVLLNIFLLASIHQKGFNLSDLPSVSSNPRTTLKIYEIHEIGGTYEICFNLPFEARNAIFRSQTYSFFILSLTCHLLGTREVPGTQ